MINGKPMIHLREIVYSVFKGKWLVIGFTITGLLIGMLVSGIGYIRGEMTKQYKIEASYLVSSQIQNGMFASRTTAPTKDDIALAKELTSQAMYVIKSDKNVSETIKKLGMVGVSAKSIQNNLTLTQFETTQIIEVSLMWRNRDEGIKILKMLEQTSSEIMLNTLMIGNVVRVNEPKATYIFGGSFDMSTWLMAALAGVLAGVGFCVLRRLLHPTLIRAEDMEDVFELELLESIEHHPKFAESEPFHIEPDRLDVQVASAANIVLDRIVQGDIKSLYVTSPGRREGRTTLLADLAVKISEAGKKVLVVDCDFENPCLAPMFGVEAEYEKSLNALYNGDSEKNDAIVRVTGGLHLLPYLLEDEADTLTFPMLDVIKSVYGGYDLVLIDAPAIGQNAEVLRLSGIADAALFVVLADGSELNEIQTSLTRLRKSGIPLIGSIVNGTKTFRYVLLEKKPKHVRKIMKNRIHKKKKSDFDEA